jgi:hypothetical protein
MIIKASQFVEIQGTTMTQLFCRLGGENSSGDVTKSYRLDTGNKFINGAQLLLSKWPQELNTFEGFQEQVLKVVPKFSPSFEVAKDQGNRS